MSNVSTESLIRRKRDGAPLSSGDIHWLVARYTEQRIPDYQMAALLMAIYFRGMSDAETNALTDAMIASGERVDLSSIPGFKVDKHSTGGVGDKTTLVLAPMIAACGLPVAKMSGRGLGHTGGTLDKLEAIPGVRTDLSIAQFVAQVRAIGLAVISQSGNLAPADGLLYALRDVTGTVESLPLIASSIMSKKLAAGADGIVLDVKTGNGAFMRDFASAEALARTMARLGSAAGHPTAAIITSMDQPLGHAVGNILEVQEAIATLSGQGPADLAELCLELGGEMLAMAGHASTQATTALRTALASGAAREKLAEMVVAQGGDRVYIDHPDRLPAAPVQMTARALSSGFVQSIDTLGIGLLARDLGAGRQKKGDPIDTRVGLLIHPHIGDSVAAGDAIAIVHAAREADAASAVTALHRLIVIGHEPVARPQLILGRISAHA